MSTEKPVADIIPHIRFPYNVHLEESFMRVTRRLVAAEVQGEKLRRLDLRRDRKFKTELYFNEEPPWQTMNFRPTYYVDVTAVETQALALVRCYVCQNGEKIARNKATRMRERGIEAPVPVTCAEAYTTFTGEPLKGGVLGRYAIAAPGTLAQTASGEAFVRTHLRDPVLAGE